MFPVQQSGGSIMIWDSVVHMRQTTAFYVEMLQKVSGLGSDLNDKNKWTHHDQLIFLNLLWNKTW